MPKRRTQDVIYAVMTDHYIQRRPPADPLAPLSERRDSDANRYRAPSSRTTRGHCRARLRIAL